MSYLFTNLYRLGGNFLLDYIGGGYDFIIASGVFPFVAEMIEPFVKKISDAMKTEDYYWCTIPLLQTRKTSRDMQHGG